MKITSFIFISLFVSLAFAAKKFEYKTVDYTNQTEFVNVLATLGAEGWELASCVTSGAAGYNGASTSDGAAITGLKVARTSYCIFKKEIE